MNCASKKHDLEQGMPTTDWKEVIAEDEEARFARYAAELRALQRARSAGGAASRALHPKGTGGFSAELEVFADVPAHAKHGLFARPGKFGAYVRFSNGAFKRQSDKRGDVRGIAVKVLGVEGKKVLGEASTQDLLAVHVPATPFRTPDEFVAVVFALAHPATAIFRLFGALGVGRTFQILRRFSKTAGAPVATLAGARFFSALPVRVGPYAARFAFMPLQAKDATLPSPRSATYLSDDLAARLRQGPLAYDLELQFFEDETRTPIEDASVDWDAPYTKVGRLTVPSQDAASDAGRALADRVEAMAFDPWHALAEHQPLGAMMRARKHAYYASIQERVAAPEPAAEQ
jgi:hypothetical protein